MSEEDLSALVTSIDENDIEILTTNGSDVNDQLDFLSDHFSIDNRNLNSPIVVPIQTTTRLIREDSEVSLKKTFSKSFFFIFVKRNLKMKH